MPEPSRLRIALDDLTGPEIAAFLEEHIRDMRRVSPPESKHALDLDGLRQPDISFWTVWEGALLVGCGALKELDPTHGEIKSMRTAGSHRGRGIGATVLQHIISVAQKRNYQQLSLETGSMDFFAPARALYAKFGFRPCAPFGSYRLDPNSVFLTRNLTAKNRSDAVAGRVPESSEGVSRPQLRHS